MGYAIVNFNNLCDAALDYFTEAYKAVILLAENERLQNNDACIKYYKAEAESKCKNAIYSCMSEKDREKHGIADYDVVELLMNTGVISGGDGYNIKKKAKEKVELFRRQIERYRGGINNPIDHFLLLLQTFEATGCITVNRDIGSVKRKYSDDEYGKGKALNARAQGRTLGYAELDDSSSGVCDEIKNRGYKGSPANPYSGGSFSHK